MILKFKLVRKKERKKSQEVARVGILQGEKSNRKQDIT
jgi:hypothetical protein